MIDPVSAVGGSSYLSTDDPTKEVVRMLLVLILMATGILLSHTAITSGGGTASIYGRCNGVYLRLQGRRGLSEGLARAMSNVL